MKSKKFLLCLSIVGMLAGGLVSCNNNSDNPPIDVPDPDLDDEDKPFDGELAAGPALPDGEKGLAIRYTRADNKVDDYALWVWEMGGEGVEYTFTAQDDYGSAAFIPLSTFSSTVETNGIGIIVKTKGTWDWQTADLMFDFSKYEADENGYYNVFLHDDVEMLFDNPDFESEDYINEAAFLSSKRIKVETMNEMSSCTIYKNDEVYLTKENINDEIVFFDLIEIPDVTAKWKVSINFKKYGNTLEKRSFN